MGKCRTFKEWLNIKVGEVLNPNGKVQNSDVKAIFDIIQRFKSQRESQNLTPKMSDKIKEGFKSQRESQNCTKNPIFQTSHKKII